MRQQVDGTLLYLRILAISADVFRRAGSVKRPRARARQPRFADRVEHLEVDRVVDIAVGPGPPALGLGVAVRAAGTASRPVRIGQ